MNKILKRIWLLAAILIILMAVFSSVFRSLTPWAKQYKVDVEHHLSSLLGQQVTIQTMETGWYWFQPVLKLNQVTLGDDPKKSFHLSKLLVGINLFKSLWHWQIQPGILYIDDIHLTLREQSGHWIINGISADALSSNDMTPEKSKQILTWFSQQERLIIKHVSAYFYFKDGGLIPVDWLNVSIVNSGGRYKLKANARLEQTNSTEFQLLGDGYFDPEHFQDIDGKFYFAAQNMAPAQWQNLFPKMTQQLEGGKGDIKLWVDIHHGDISLMQAQVKLENLAWRLLNNQHRQLIQSVAANLSWKPNNTGWQLHGDHIQLRVGGFTWPENQIAVNYDETQQSYQLFVKNILIESLWSKAINWPKSLQQIVRLKPQGMLRDTQVLIKLSSLLFRIPPIPHFPSSPVEHSIDGENSWAKTNEINYILTRFEQLGWNGNSKKSIPEIRNLSGVVNWQPEEGRLELDSVNTKIAVKGYPSQELELLNGVFDWKELNDGLRVSVDQFVLSKPDLTLSAQGAIDQVTRDSVGYVRLNADFSGKEIQQWSAFLPKKMMKPKLYAWLRDDLKRVAEISGKITLNGLAREFPFDNNHGEFLIESHVIGGELYINHQWKIIKEIDGAIELKNRNLNIDISHADFHGVPAKQINLRIDDIGKNKENLVINGAIHAPIKKMVNYVMSSPLHNKLVLLNQLSPKGTAQLDLNVQVPLYPENDDVLVKGNLIFNDNKVLVKHDLVSFTLENLTGKLFFNEDGVNDSTLQANALGNPLSIKVLSVKTPIPAITIEVAGTWTSNLLKNHFNLPILSVVNGSFLINTVLRLANNPSDPNTISFHSSLEGLAIDLPAPLGKKEHEEAPLTVTLDLNSEKALGVNLNYKDMAIKAKRSPSKDWIFSLKQKNIDADLVYQGKNNELSGHVQRLHLDKIDTSTLESSTKIHPAQIPNLNLQVDNLSVGKILVGDLIIKSHSTAEQWSLNSCRIDTPEYQFDIQGEWTQKQNIDTTKLDLKLTINDLAKSFARWDIEPVVEAKKGYLAFKGGWNNSFYNPSLPSLNGDMFLQLKKGRITNLSKETEEKLDLGKLLSILSLQTIPRRLQLDFSDLSHNGYSFDIFQGNFQINKGIMNTQDSYLDGPVAYASMKGNLDLVRRIYDLNLTISPHITASLPIVATIAGGPVAGVAAWVATKIINQGMQKIVAYSYKISGPWNRPVVQQLSMIKKKMERVRPPMKSQINSD